MLNGDVTTRLFGTDGVRGTAGQYPVDPPTVRRLGAALVRALPCGPGKARLLVGRDTRESGSWIEAELAHGALGEGAIVTSVGIMPTPVVACLTRLDGYDAGVVISASHNPFEDNGIKVFSRAGEKISARVEHEIERIVADSSWSVASGEPEGVPHVDLEARYLEQLLLVLPQAGSLKGFKLALDCANGAMTGVAPRLFDGLGFETTVIANEPNGRNINLHCGSTHPEKLAQMVVERGCQMGVAFDGDGDRAIFVDHLGRIVDGDAVLLMCGRQLQREGRLNGNTVVTTVMSNIGLELAFRASGIELVRCPVGDKYVMEEILARRLSLGGEQSGHIIFAEHLVTGDGLCTALHVLRTVVLTGRSLAELAGDLVTFPQVLLNVRVANKVNLAEVLAVAAVINKIESKVAGEGRLLVRYSGTEPLLRVMLEGRRENEIRAWGQEIVDAVKQHIG